MLWADLMSGTTSRPRVLWLTKGLGLGGAERVLHLSGRAIDMTRFEVEIAYALPWKNAMEQQIRDLGIVVRCLGTADGQPRLWLRSLGHLLRTRSYDIVHTHSPLVAAAARVAPATGHPVFVHTEHSAWSRYRSITRVANAVTYGRNAAVFAVSEAVLRSISPPAWRLHRRWPEAEVLYHGIDEAKVLCGPAARSSARARLGCQDDESIIGTVASLTPKKDHPTLLRAFTEVRHDIPSARLIVVGGGPREGELRELARDLGLGDAVSFLGVRADVQEILPGFDVFALSSKREGLGLALVEAMAAGVPCAATKVDGIPEVIEEGVNGVLVPPGAPSALSRALTRLLHDPGLRSRLRDGGIASVQRFSIQNAMRRLERRYDEVLERGAA